jgi:hypothetical protein
MVLYAEKRGARSTGTRLVGKLGTPRNVRHILGEHYHDIFRWLRLETPDFTPTAPPSPLSESAASQQQESTNDSPNDNTAAASGDLLKWPDLPFFPRRRKPMPLWSRPLGESEDSGETLPPAKRRKLLDSQSSDDKDSALIYS